ncbi:hypothetical protein TS85_16595 [Sphingomonas hengshuiensis]|uniref:Uncharacterized protein n=2 Tax=Sphingomonas hengshuiensis TaxID=1609977 RepID=A0A7U5BG02_9SPHN|nr:hypothetical protein [Sphingomonas hengshuiensis]AJP74585.1 hypothetical protein TS85_16595 [Sphingomonas hengshuiensis]
MTRADLQDILVTALLRQWGGTKRRWRLVIGPVRLYDPATHPHCNWSIAPAGTAGENAAIEAALDELRGQHPILLD